jgi:hypothetical protein
MLYFLQYSAAPSRLQFYCVNPRYKPGLSNGPTCPGSIQIEEQELGIVGERIER